MLINVDWNPFNLKSNQRLAVLFIYEVVADTDNDLSVPITVDISSDSL